MGSRAKLAVGVGCGAALAGLVALASPALALVGDTLGRALESPAPVASSSATAGDVIPPFDGESTDYTDWTDEQLTAARAADPHPFMINHPTRFAGNCLQNSVMTDSGALDGAQTLVDMGPTEFAQGTVARSADGRIASYTVAPGDAGDAIGERFCVDYVTVFQYNDVWPVPHPGDFLSLVPASDE